VIIPPAVLTELSHASAPIQISNWATHPPPWVTVSTPASIPGRFDGLDFGERQALALAMPGSIPERYDSLDFGERQALALATEIHADLVLLDDKVARRGALRELMHVKGTLGIVADAARAGLLDFAETAGLLQRTSMHLDQDVVDEVIREFKNSEKK